MSGRARWATASLVLIGLLAVATLRSSATATTLSPGGWMMIPPSHVSITGKLSDRRLAEASGAAASRANPGVIWTIEDSGNPPDLLAIDTTGALRADFTVAGASNVDWEEVALGPCGSGQCVYIADTGDNGEHRRDVVIYRVPEPTVGAGLLSGVQSLTGMESIRAAYPDRPHDVEAMAVTDSGEILLVTKGRSGGVLLFSIPADAWRSGRLVTPVLRDSLPITPAGGMGREVTGMALASDGKRVVVRTYRDLYPFTLRPDGKLAPMGKPTACDILGLEPQGEGVTFLRDGRLLLTSERGLFKAGTVILMNCAPLDL